MEEIKSKFLDLINKQVSLMARNKNSFTTKLHSQNRHVKIPAMGFSEYFIQNLSSPTETPSVDRSNKKHSQDDFRRLPDQEILDATEEIYFQENVNCEEYELRVSTQELLLFLFTQSGCTIYQYSCY